jgi:hypothetical protein
MAMVQLVSGYAEFVDILKQILVGFNEIFK